MIQRTQWPLLAPAFLLLGVDGLAAQEIGWRANGGDVQGDRKSVV